MSWQTEQTHPRELRLRPSRFAPARLALAGAVTAWLVGGPCGKTGWAQPALEAAVATAETPLDAAGNLVRFERDIAPILRSRCVKCHGPEDAKADFRIDDPDRLMDYLEAGDAASSTLYVDYLTSADDDMLMPPREHQGPLPAGELALIRIWIDEGAHWPEDYQLVGTEPPQADEEAVVASETPLSLSGRVWKAMGYLHPATIHFPIALFLLGGMFVVLGIRWPAIGTQIPLACLWIGTATAVASSLMGWSLAPTAGYGASWELLNFEREVDAHRWSAVIVTLIAAVCSLIAIVALWKDSRRLSAVWKGGLVALALMVGLVGHQGGEMVYGRDFYPAMFRVLRGESEASPVQTAPAAAAEVPVATVEAP